MITIEKLKSYGADVDEGLRRCLNDESFYLSLVSSVIPDKRLNELKETIENGNLEAAFEIAHSLKGMYGNISITPIYEPVCEITELLRSKTETDYTDLLSEALSQKEKLDLLVD